MAEVLHHKEGTVPPYVDKTAEQPIGNPGSVKPDPHQGITHFTESPYASIPKK